MRAEVGEHGMRHRGARLWGNLFHDATMDCYGEAAIYRGKAIIELCFPEWSEETYVDSDGQEIEDCPVYYFPLRDAIDRYIWMWVGKYASGKREQRAARKMIEELKECVKMLEDTLQGEMGVKNGQDRAE